MMLRTLLIFLALYVCRIPFTASAQLRIIPREKIDSVANPRLSCDSASLDFKVRSIVSEPMNEDDGKMDFIFPFVNVGDKVVEIKRLGSSCSCASAVCTRMVIAPGENAEVVVTYNPKGHPGRFERKVYVYTGDGSAPAAILRLAVDVSGSADVSGLWPVDMGKIRMRRSEVHLPDGKKAVESLRFINVSGGPLKLECETAMLPPCLRFSVDPEIVENGAEGKIMIHYDPSKGGSKARMLIILKGLGLPPSRSSVTVSVK